MKKIGSILILSLFLMGCSVLSISQTHEPEENIEMVRENSINESSKHPKEALDTVVNFLEDRHSIDRYGQQLRARLEQGEFNHLWNESYSVYDATVFDHYEIGSQGQKISVFIIDTVLKKDKYFQWLQFKVTWDEENQRLLNLEYQPIDYWSRINREGEVKTARTFVETTLSTIHDLNPEQFGWRYQGQNPLISSSIEKIEVIAILPMGYLFSDRGEMDEALVKAEYSVTMLGKSHDVDAIIYVRRYEENWQIEDIQVMNAVNSHEEIMP